MRFLRSFLSVFLLLAIAQTGRSQSAPQNVRDYVYGPGGRLVVTMEPDVYPPSPPDYIWATPGECAIDGVDVEWGNATDIGTGVASYTLYRDGSWRTTTTGNTYHDSYVQALQTYTYSVLATDNAGHSGDSASTSVQIPLCISGISILRYAPARRGAAFRYVSLVANAPAQHPTLVAATRGVRFELPPPALGGVVVAGGVL